MESTIIDASSKFSRRKQAAEDGSTKPDVTVSHVRHRLPSAKRAADRLRETPRVEEPDRLLLARNLGHMCERAYGSEAKTRLNEIFIRAFGAEIGDSHYKKRKRYVRFTSELPDAAKATLPNEFVAHGREYLALARALSEDMKNTGDLSDEERANLGVLRLIAGTTFDTRTSLKDRANQEARDELIKALDIAVDRVLGHVPLDEIREWAQVNPVGVVGTTGVMKEAALVGYATDGWGRALDYTGNVIDDDKDGFCENRIGPCVRLAEIYSEVPTNGSLIVELDTDTHDESNFAQAAASALAAQIGIANPGANRNSLWPVLADLPSWTPCEDGRSSSGIYIKRVLDLELRFRPDVERWELCIVLRADRDEMGEVCGQSRLFASRGELLFDGPRRSVLIGKQSNEEEDIIYAIPHHPIEEKPKCIVVAASIYDIEWTAFPKFMGFSEALLSVSTEEAQTLLFGVPSDPCYVLWKIDTSVGRPTPAPHDSIGGAILRNLAFAPLEKRIDRMLLQDAKGKADMIKALQARCAEEYRTAMSTYERRKAEDA